MQVPQNGGTAAAAAETAAAAAAAIGGAEDGANSMTARRQAPAAAADVRTLGLFSAIGLLTTLMLQVRETPQPQELLIMACTDLPLLAALAWALLAPASYRRCRGGVALVLRLLVCLRVLSVDTTRLLEASMPVSDSLALALLHFIFTLAAASWLLPLGQMAWGLELPPISSALVQLASVALIAAGNPQICATGYMHQPLVQKMLATTFRVLQPAAAPLEPLLTLAGIGRRYQDRQCISVLWTLQFWGALVLPVALTWRRQLHEYLEWRQQLKRERQREVRAARLASLPFPGCRRRSSSSSGGPRRRRFGRNRTNPGSGSGSGSGGSGGSGGRRSPNSGSGGRRSSSARSSRSSGLTGTTHTTSTCSISQGSLEEMAGLFASGEDVAALIRGRPSRHVVPHPHDWQYETAAKLRKELKPTWKSCTLLAFLALHLYSWHLMLFSADAL